MTSWGWGQPKVTSPLLLPRPAKMAEAPPHRGACAPKRTDGSLSSPPPAGHGDPGGPSLAAGRRHVLLGQPLLPSPFQAAPAKLRSRTQWLEPPCRQHSGSLALQVTQPKCSPSRVPPTHEKAKVPFPGLCSHHPVPGTRVPPEPSNHLPTGTQTPLGADPRTSRPKLEGAAHCRTHPLPAQGSEGRGYWWEAGKTRRQAAPA